MDFDFTEYDEMRLERICSETEYSNPRELVRNALRRRLNELEAEELTSTQLKRDLFRCQTIPGNKKSLTQVRFIPQEDSQIRFRYFHKGNPPHTAYLDTGNTVIGADEIENNLTDIDKIENCLVPNTTGDTRVRISENNNQPLNKLIEDVRDVLYNLIRERDKRIEQNKETRGDAKSRALRGYWKYSHQFGQ